MIFTLKSVKKLLRKIDDAISKRSPVAWGTLGLFVLALGISIGWIVFPIILNKMLPNKINLAFLEDTRRHWMHMPVFDFNIYLFNVTNYEAVRRGAKPALQEIGPYCYREFKEKVDPREDPKADTISYRSRSTWLRSQEGAGCAAPHLTGDEMLVVPNVPLLSKADTISYRSRSTWLRSQEGAGCAAPHLTGDEMLVVPNVIESAQWTPVACNLEGQPLSMIFTLKSVKKLLRKIDEAISKRSPVAWGTLGLFVLALGISIGWIVFPIILNKMLPNKINLAFGEDTRRHWMHMPVFDFNIYLFNVTNYEAVRRGARPALQEIGPYCYREFKEKVDLREDPKADTISYRSRSTWLRSQEGAGCAAPHLTGDEMLVVPNVPLLSVLLVAEKDFPPPFLAAVNVALPSIFGDNSDLFLTASARTLLFGGILIDCWRRGLLTGAVCSALRDRSSRLKKLGEDRYSFSYLGAKNGSVERSEYTVRRGAEVAAEVGQLVAVDGQPQLSYWRGDCNILHGTDGSIFPPFRQPDNHSVVAYSGEVCRVIYGVYEGLRVSNGVTGYAYSVTFGDTDSNPQDKCYCAAEDRCYRKGTLDAFKCQGAPLVASLPHFYAANEDYVRGVDGLRPDKDKHGILVVLEPTSGSPLVAKKRIQMNIDLKPIRFTPNTQSLRRALVPLFWAEELFELNGELLELLQASLLRPIKVVHVGSWVLVVLGAIFLAFAVAIKIKRIRRDNLLDPGKSFDYSPDFKEKLKYLESEETVVRGPFFIDTQQSLPQPRWGKPRTVTESPTRAGIVKTTETSLAGDTKTVKYKRISGLKEIMVKEQTIDS